MSDRTTTPGRAIWAHLLDAHARAAPTGRHTDEPPPHRPEAAILACSDARVPPSLIFGRPSGSLFVVRVAGNSATPDVVASITYAVVELGTELVIVLGHTSCGAVTAAMTGVIAPELRPILEPIDEMLETCDRCDDVDRAVVANVRKNMHRIRGDSGSLGAAVCGGRVELRGAVHDLRTGAIVDVTSDDETASSHPQPVRSPR